jgi:chondroitin AC lyase
MPRMATKLTSRTLSACAALLTLALTSRAFSADIPSPAMLTLASQFRDYSLGTPSGHGDRLLDDVDLPKTSTTEANHLLATLQTDGSWSDIDYKNPDRSAWPAFAHLSRILSITLSIKRNLLLPADNPRALAAIHRALAFWMQHDFKNPNWWFNQIGEPKIMGTLAILLDTDLQPDEQKYITHTVMPRSKVGAMTGQNRVWLAGNGLMNAILTHDDALAHKATKIIADEITVSTGAEGIQPDWSFHQHGPQQQFGNYGRAFALDITRWAVILRNTPFAFPLEKTAILRNYLLQGQNWITWRGAMDISSCDRQLTPNSPIAKAAALIAIMQTMAVVDPDHAHDYLAFVTRNTTDHPNDLLGTRYFYRSDYLLHRTPDLFVSLKMHSNRVKGGETVNDENLSGNHLADGATYFYQSGNEYTDIFPCWNWRMIPGTTSALDHSPLTWIGHDVEEKKKSTPKEKKPEPPKTDPTDTDLPPVITVGSPTGPAFVGAVTNATAACAAMDFDRDKLHAHKAWFFDHETTYCLGTAITSTDNSEIVTTLNQSLLHGPITIAQNSKTTTLNSTAEEFLLNPTSIEHDHLRYTLLSPAHVQLTASPTTGNWKSVFTTASTPKPDLTKNLFTLSLTHGPHPTNASYAYAISPTTAPLPAAKILANTPDLQALQLPDHTLALIFWTPTTLTLPTHTISTNHPCLLLLNLETKIPQITIVDPTQSLSTITITIDNTPHTLTLPTGPLAGSSLSQP